MSLGSWAERRADQPGGFARLLRGLRVQVRVTHALLLREMQTRFGRNQLGFLWLFLEPLMLAGAIAGFKSLTVDGGHYAGVSPFIFALVGYLPYFCFRAIVSRAPGTLRANLTLLFHTQIKLLDVVNARHLLEAAAVVSVMTLVVLGAVLWGDMTPHSLPMLMLALILLFLLGHGVGLIAAAASARSEIVERLIHPMIYLSLPLSGAFFALHHIDPSLREILLWNPQAHIHEMVRYGFFGDKLPCYFDVGYVLFWLGVLNLIGLAAMRAVRPKLEF